MKREWLHNPKKQKFYAVSENGPAIVRSLLLENLTQNKLDIIFTNVKFFWSGVFRTDATETQP